MKPITFLTDRSVNTQWYTVDYHVMFNLSDNSDFRAWLTAEQRYQEFWDHVRMNEKDCRIIYNKQEYTITLLDNTKTGYYLVDEDDRIVTKLEDHLITLLVTFEMIDEVNNK